VPRLSATLDDDQYEWVQRQAAELDRSQADVLRRCINLVRSGAVDTDALRSDAMHDAPDADALDELRDRVDELEDRVDELTTGPDADTDDIDVSAAPSSGSEPYPQRVETALDVLRRADEPLRRGQIMDHVESAAAVVDDTLWTEHVRPGIREAGAELVGRRWVLNE